MKDSYILYIIFKYTVFISLSVIFSYVLSVMYYKICKYNFFGYTLLHK